MKIRLGFIYALMLVLALTGAALAQATHSVTYTETTVTPGTTVRTPFGDTTSGDTSTTVKKTIVFDDANAAALQALCAASSPSSHLTTAQLSLQYTPAELSAALSASLAK